MDNHGHSTCVYCWSVHPADAPCVRYRTVPVGEGGPVAPPAEVARDVEANLRTEIGPGPDGKGGR